MRKLLAGDLNAQEKERLLDTFLNQHELHSNNNNPSCYKNLNNLGKINLILTNCLKRFFKMDTVFTDLSHFHKPVLSVFTVTTLRNLRLKK